MEWDWVIFHNLGASHIIVLAYKFKNNNFDYGDDEEEGALIEPAPIQKTW